MPVPDPLVTEVLTEDASTDHVLIEGYVGPASNDGSTRVYTDAELSTFVEIPAGAIKHQKKIDPDGTFGQRTALWIDGWFLRAPLAYEFAHENYQVSLPGGSSIPLARNHAQAFEFASVRGVCASGGKICPSRGKLCEDEQPWYRDQP